MVTALHCDVSLFYIGQL